VVKCCSVFAKRAGIEGDLRHKAIARAKVVRLLEVTARSLP